MKATEHLSDKALRQRIRANERVLDEIERADPAEVVRAGKADETLARLEAAIDTVQEAQAELAERSHHSLPERLLRYRTLERGRREQHPAQRWLEAARRYSAPELQGETLVADRLTEEDATELERIIKKKRELVNDERAEPLTDAETAEWERLLGKAAGDEDLFGRKRRDAAARGKLDELIDARKVAKLPRQPLLAEPGSVQLPRFVFSWLVGPEAHDGAFSLADLGLLAALLGAFANEDPSLIVGARFDQEGELTLVAPGAVGQAIQFHGKIAGSPIEEGSGFVRGNQALAVLVRNKWFEVEQPAGELRIRLGERAKKLAEARRVGS